MLTIVAPCSPLGNKIRVKWILIALRSVPSTHPPADLPLWQTELMTQGVEGVGNQMCSSCCCCRSVRAAHAACFPAASAKIPLLPPLWCWVYNGWTSVRSLCFLDISLIFLRNKQKKETHQDLSSKFIFNLNFWVTHLQYLKTSVLRSLYLW